MTDPARRRRRWAALALAVLAVCAGIALLFRFAELRDSGDIERNGASERDRRAALSRIQLRSFACSVQGRVTVRDGSPAPDVAVLAGEASWGFDDIGTLLDLRTFGRATTDASGFFSFASLPCGPAQIAALAPGHPGAALRVLLAPGETADVLLTLEAGGYRVTGIVEDSGGGPIDGAKLAFVPVHGGALTYYPVGTDRGGAYEVRLNSGLHLVAVMAQGYAPDQSAISVEGDIVRSFKLRPTARVQGVVVSNSEGPVAGADVTLSRQRWPVPEVRTTRSTADGRFSFSGLAPGVFALTARRGGAAGSAVGDVRVAAGETVAELTISITDGATVAGCVQDDQGGPVPVAAVQFRGARGERISSSTDSAGEYSVEGLLPSEYLITVERSGYAPLRQPLVIVRPERVKHDLKITRAGRVNGVVTDWQPASEGTSELVAIVAPAVGAVSTGPLVKVVPISGGRFAAVDLTPGMLSLRLTSSAQGVLKHGPVPLTAGQVLEVEMGFGHGGTVPGTAVWSDGSPARRLKVVAADDTGPVARAYTDDQGAFRLGPLPPGTFTIFGATNDWMTVPGGVPHRGAETIVVSAGRTPPPVRLIVEKPDRAVSGSVIDVNNTPVRDARVVASIAGARAMEDALSSPTTTTDENGRFAIEGLTSGPYTLRATHPSYADSQPAQVQAGDSGLKLVLSSGSIVEVRAVDAEGRPVAHYQLTVRSTGRQDITQQVASPEGLTKVGPLPSGKYDFVAETLDGRDGALTAVEVDAARDPGVLAVALRPGAVVSGRLLDYDTKRAPSGIEAMVKTKLKVGPLAIDKDGRFHATGLPREEIQLGFVSRGERKYAPEVRTIDLAKAVSDLDVGDILLVPVRTVVPDGYVGVAFDYAGQSVVARQVLQGSPAEEAGLRTGERIVAVDGNAITGVGPAGLFQLLRGTPGGTVTVDAEGAGGRRSVTIRRTSRP